MLPFPSAPDNLCILRLSAIGDVCHTLPVVRTLQYYWPNTQLTWIIGQTEADLIGDIPGIDFIVFNKSAGWPAYRLLRFQLKNRRFDALLHMQCALRASVISRLVKTKIRLGFDYRRAREAQWLFTTHRIAAKPRQHVMDGLFGFTEALGITQRRLVWDIPISSSARDFAASVPNTSSPLLVIHPSASAALRNWCAQRYAAVSDYAVEKYQLHVVLTGGPSAAEHRLGAEIMRHTSYPVTNLIGKTSLKQLLALLERARVLIAPDTDPIHMATAVATPAIGLYANSNPLRSGPYASQQWVINQYPQAVWRERGQTMENVRWGTRVRHPKAMDLISVQAVIQSLDAVMNSAG